MKEDKELLRNLSRQLPAGYTIVPNSPSELMLSYGMQHNHQHNGEKNVIETYKEMVLTAEYTLWEDWDEFRKTSSPSS